MASGAAFSCSRTGSGTSAEVSGPSRWRKCVAGPRYAHDDTPGSVKRWMAAVAEWRPDGHRLRAAVGDVRAWWSAGVRQQYPRDGSGSGTMSERQARGLPTRGRRSNSASNCVITTFFRPPLRRGRTTLVPPMVAVPSSRRSCAATTVYSGGSEALIASRYHVSAHEGRSGGRHDRQRRDRVPRAVGGRVPRGPRHSARRYHRRRVSLLSEASLASRCCRFRCGLEQD